MNDRPKPEDVKTIEDAASFVAWCIGSQITLDEELGLQEIRGGKIEYNQFAEAVIMPDYLDDMQKVCERAFTVFDENNVSLTCFLAVIQLRKGVSMLCDDLGTTNFKNTYGWSDDDFYPIGHSPRDGMCNEVGQAVSRMAMSGIEGFVLDGRGFVGMDMDAIRTAGNERVIKMADLLLRLDFEVADEPTGFAFKTGEGAQTVDEAVDEILANHEPFLHDDEVGDIDNDDDYDDTKVIW